MDMGRVPKPGEIYHHFKDKLYQIITVALHTETEEAMVVYQALYGDYKTYVRPLASFLSEVDQEKYPDAKQKFRFELQAVNYLSSFDSIREMVKDNTERKPHNPGEESADQKKQNVSYGQAVEVLTAEKVTESDRIRKTEKVTVDEEPDKSTVGIMTEGTVNPVLLKFLEAESYYKKLEVITSSRKHMNDRLVNDIAVSLDCAVDEGPLDQRIQDLIFCLQALCRFEDKRLR